MHTHLMQLKAEREFVLCGDINIAHRKEDLKNWRGNQKNSGFTPEERAWMDMLLAETDTGGIKDVYRCLQPDTTDACYTWWSDRGQAYANNVGWRLDYHLATPSHRCAWPVLNPSTKARSSQTMRQSRVGYAMKL